MEKELKDMTVDDVIATEEFRSEMQMQIERERESHRRAMYDAVERGMRLGRSVFDSMDEKGVLNDEDMTALYRAALAKSLIGFSAAERMYISAIGRVVYVSTVRKLQEQKT